MCTYLTINGYITVAQVSSADPQWSRPGSPWSYLGPPRPYTNRSWYLEEGKPGSDDGIVRVCGYGTTPKIRPQQSSQI